MKSEKGFSMIEVMIAMVLMSIVAVAFLGAMGTASRAVFITDERATAESLARAQMEYVKEQVYIPSADQATYLKIADSQIPEGYAVCSISRNNQLVEDIVYAIPWSIPLFNPEGQPASTNTGLQRVKLVIKHLDEQVLTLEDFKVQR